MTGSRKVLLVIAALAVTAYALPMTHDELSWWWAESLNHSDSYLRYLSDWPKGRHAVEARLRCFERQRAEIKRAEIPEAYGSSPGADAFYNRERALRKDNFSWMKATNLDTISSYRDYLNQFPKGRHTGEARQKLQSLGHAAANTDAPSH